MSDRPAPACPRRRFGAASDAKQLFPLHDEVDGPDNGLGQPQWPPMESVAGTAARANEETRHAGRHFIEHERPRHVWRAVRRQPAKRQHPLGFDRQQRESLGHAGQRGEDRADGRMLKFRHDPRGARPPAVVEPVVAVPAAAAARSHLHQPRPHVTRRASNRHAVRQRVDGLWNPLVSGQCACAFVCGGANRPPGPAGTERSAAVRSARRRTARNNCQVTNAPAGLITRQYRANLRTATRRQRTRRVLEDQPVFLRPARRCHANAHEQLLVAGIVERVERLAVANRRGAWLTRCSCAADPVMSSRGESSRRMSVPPSISVDRNGRVESTAGMCPSKRTEGTGALPAPRRASSRAA